VKAEAVHDALADSIQAETEKRRRILEWRVARALGDAPDLMMHVRSLVIPVGAAQLGARVSGSKEPPAPLRLNPLDDADEAYAQLRMWCWTWAEKLDQPSPASASVVWQNLQGEPGGFRAGVTPEGAHALTSRLTAWLVARQAQINRHPLSDDYLAEIIFTFGQMQARYPHGRKEQDRTRRADARECPICHQDGVRAYWYSMLDDPTGIVITCAFCGADTGEILAAGPSSPGTEMGLHGDQMSRMTQILAWIDNVPREKPDPEPFDPADPEHIELRKRQEHADV
jgi:hypothetical protein